MAFTAVGALIAGEAVTATLVLSAVAEVGMAMTVVGAVTGSKSLMKIGGAMSLIGGIGGMVAGSGAGGAAAAGAEAAGSSALESAASEALTAGASDAAINATTDTLLGELAPQTLASQGTGMINTAMQPTALQPSAMAPSATVGEQVATQAADTGLGSNLAPTGPAEIGAPTTPADTNPTDMRLNAGTQSSPMNAPEGSGSFFNRVSKFANDNKTLVGAGLQLAGGALKGASDAKMWNEKMALERERSARANSVGNFAPRSTGIIAGARA